jgi:transposase InsO family protein
MKAAHDIDLMCRVLKVGRSSFYDWRKGRRRKPRAHDALNAAIREAFQKSRGTYGHRRIYEELRNGPVKGSRKLILRLMNEMKLEATPWKPSPYAALKKAQESIVCPHLLERNFKPTGPNQVWTGDITYIWTRAGWMYLAVVLDLYSRRVVGWNVSDRPNTDLALAALSQALASRWYVWGELIFHSDQGCQYTSRAFQEYLKERGIRGSMSRKGQCWDNAPTESFFKSFKRETGVRRLHLAGRGEVEMLALDWIETWYNLRRKHTFVRYSSPAEHEMKRAA